MPEFAIAPAVVRLSDGELVRTVTGFSARTLRRLAVTEGAPVIFRGEGNGRREFLVVADFVAWLRDNASRVTAGALADDGDENA